MVRRYNTVAGQAEPEEVEDNVEVLEVEDQKETFKSLKDILSFVPLDPAGFSIPVNLLAGVPEIQVHRSSFSALTMQLLCQGIQDRIFGLLSTQESMRTMSLCGVATSAKSNTPVLKAARMGPSFKLYLPGTVSPTPSMFNSIMIAVRVSGLTVNG